MFSEFQSLIVYYDTIDTCWNYFACETAKEYQWVGLPLLIRFLPAHRFYAFSLSFLVHSSFIRSYARLLVRSLNPFLIVFFLSFFLEIFLLTYYLTYLLTYSASKSDKKIFIMLTLEAAVDVDMSSGFEHEGSSRHQ